MNDKILQYAMKNIVNISTDATFNIVDNRIYIEFKDGRNLQIAEDEIRYQAIQYLESEISYINTNF